MLLNPTITKPLNEISGVTQFRSRLAPRTTIVLFRHVIVPGQPTHLERAKVILHEKNPYKCSLTIQDAKLNSNYFH